MNKKNFTYMAMNFYSQEKHWIFVILLLKICLGIDSQSSSQVLENKVTKCKKYEERHQVQIVLESERIAEEITAITNQTLNIFVMFGQEPFFRLAKDLKDFIQLISRSWKYEDFVWTFIIENGCKMCVDFDDVIQLLERILDSKQHKRLSKRAANRLKLFSDNFINSIKEGDLCKIYKNSEIFEKLVDKIKNLTNELKDESDNYRTKFCYLKRAPLNLYSLYELGSIVEYFFDGCRIDDFLSIDKNFFNEFPAKIKTIIISQKYLKAVLACKGCRKIENKLILKSRNRVSS